MLFIAIYFYFIIQIIMASKWKDPLTMEQIKEKLNWIPATVTEKTKTVKKKIEDNSDTVKKWVKNIWEKASENIQKWKDFIIETYNDIKSKINEVSTKVKEKWVETSNKWNIDKDSISELIKSNKELKNIVTKLIDKYDKSIKLLEEINKNLSKKK